MSIVTKLIKIIKDNLISIIICFTLSLCFMSFTAYDVIKFRPISMDTLIMCATLVITILMTLLTSSKSSIFKYDKKKRAASTCKCFICFLLLDLIFLVLIDSIKISKANYDLECVITTLLGCSFFICYLISIILLLSLLYNLAEFIEDFQDKIIEQSHPKNEAELTPKEDIHMHIHKD